MNSNARNRSTPAGLTPIALQLLLILLFFWVFVGVAAANCSGTYTYTSNGGNANYTLTAGQSLQIASGIYTGIIDNLANTATICIDSTATFKPSNMNNVAGKLLNYGTAELQTFAYNTGTVIDNYGTLKFLGGLNTNGAVTFYNRANATMTMANSFQLGNNSTFTNDGLVSAAQDFNTQQSTTLTNNYRLETKGNFNPDGIFINNGRVYSEKFINMNANLDVTNNCLLVSFDGFNSNNPNVTNNGTILITKPGNKWQHNSPGTFRNGANAKVAGQDFINNSTIIGSGTFIFSGSTTNQGTFAGNSSSDKINFYDETQTGSQIFDAQNTAPTNTLRTAIARPTELDAPPVCSVNYRSFSQGCPNGSLAYNQTGNATSQTKSGTVNNPDKAIGALAAVNSTATSTNSASVGASGVLSLDLGTVIPAGSPLIISLAQDTNTSRVRIETSLNDVTYTSAGTFGASGTLGSSTTLDKLSRLTLTVPAGGIRYVRFVREASTNWVDGVEYSQVCQPVSYDFGDAPASYGAASHGIVSGIHLGDNVPDADTANQPTYNANGDGDDEDGAPKQYGNPAITLFPILKATATSYSVEIKATNTTGTAGKLHGWIDFDHSGTFDADEAAVATVGSGTTNGMINLVWNNIPVDIKIGTTFIRLRLSTDNNVTTNTPATHASDGEVEDFPLAVAIDVPPDSPDVTIVRGENQACSSTIFTDNFDDLASEQYFGVHTSATPFVIRNWTAAGGGNDTYARTIEVSPFAATQGRSIYFGNGMIRRYYPDTGAILNFDGNGRMLNPPDAIELRDNADDVTPNTREGQSDWGPEPVTLSRSFASTPGQRYRLYFSAIPEEGEWNPGIMRVDTPSGSVHFKAPGLNEGIQKYRIEFTATGTTSTIRFVNYGHIGTDGGWCDPSAAVTGNAWCTVGGFPVDKKGNELIIDDVAVALASACPNSGISGFVYVDSNGNNNFENGIENGIANINVMLYDNNGTTNTTSDDTQIASTSTGANGAYSFTNIAPSLRYRIEVDARDSDLPASASIGTTNPLADVSVTAGSTLNNQNFGFDLACNASAGQFGGIAFRDYNQNGVREIQEEGIAGITVTAYDSTNTAVATATTGAQGWYTLTGLTNGSQYRLEYTGIPSGLHPGAAGTDTVSTVRFVTASGSCAANLGLSDPIEYCQANPPVAAATFVNGNPNSAAVGNYAHIFAFPYEATGKAYEQNPEPVSKANVSQTGAVWGLAYQKTSKTLFASATMRRFSGFGSLGTGGIYKLDMSNPYAWHTGATPYIDLRSIGIDTGSDVRIASDSCNNLASDPWAASRDVAAWDKVGKVGVGDMDYDEVNNRLWLINLNDRKLYGINNLNPSSAPTAANVLGGYSVNLPSPYACTSGTFRPWAVKVYRSYVYVGGVCDAASDPYNNSKVRGYVLRFNPANAAAGFTYIKDFPLNQPRSSYGYNVSSEWTGWLPQADALSVRPQFHSPIVGNLEFDTDGSIIVGIIDRAGLQKGTNAYDEPACDDPTIDYSDTMGDVLRLCKTTNGYLTDAEPGCATAIPANSKTNNEYYWGDLGPSNNAWEGMNEIAAGGLALAPGKTQVLASAYDANSWGSNGVVWLNNRTGAKDNSFHVSWSTLGKSTGMGELEVLCDPAPVEIGNRVWLDTDKDGIQDAGESGISNVSVTLTCGADSATTTTNSAGEYYFSNAPSKNATFMDNGESCSLSIANTQASLNGFTLTTANADGKTDNNAQTDIRDSDAAVNGSNAVINFTAGNAGQNNHGLDFGYQSSSASTSNTIAGKVFEDKNYGGGAGRPATASGTAGINNARVELYNATGGFVTSTSTDSSGNYTFSNLANGNYFVRVVNDSVRSKRFGSNGTERGVQTFRSDGTTAVANEVGGRKPALVDAPANANNQTLNPTDFKLSGGGQAQSVQPITINSGSISGADFGFNFSTVVNANDSGQGSLRQFLNNASIFTDKTALAQAGLASGKETAILMLPTTDPNYNATDNYWSIALQSALPSIGNDMVLDGSKQAGFANRPVIELNGTNAGNSTDGLTLNGPVSGAEVSNLAINRFKGAGIKVLQAQNNKIINNVIGLDPTATLPRGNQGNGITISVPLGSNSISTNRIAYNGGDGINATGQDGRTVFITANSIYANTKLGIDLANNGITLNDANDADTGINNLLNFPMLSNAQLSGNNLTLSGCAPAGAKVELFKADVSPTGTATAGANKFGKSKDYGEGQVFLAEFVEGSASDTSSAACNLAADADGNNQTGMQAFQVTVNLAASLSAGDLLTATATLTSSGTSEFSPVFAPTVGCSLVVTTTADTDNAANNSGSLRDAIQCANATPEADMITFNIPTSEPGYMNPDSIVGNGDDYWSIKPTTPLPGITQPLVIDGSTQPGTSCPQPRVEIDGSSAGADADGIGLYASNSTIKGLIINNFSRSGIRLSRFPINFPGSVTLQTNNSVQCSYIGVNASGLVAKPNLKGGIAAEGDSMKIGGVNTAERNIISGNGEFGIYFFGGGSTNGTVQGNYIGVGANGTTALGNQGFGIGYYNTDGGGLIGGTTGITVNGACTGACNLIAHNTSAGIGSFWTGPAGRNIRISGNSIHSNGGIGIDLEGSSAPWELDGVTPNDLGDSDSMYAPNALQNYPVISKATLSNGNTVVTGTLNSIANKTFTLEFFANTTADPSGHGEGERYLGNTTVNTDASGNANFTVNLPEVALGTFISSTATDAVSNTSEFSGSVAVNIERTLSGRVFEDINYGGGAGRNFDASKGMVGIVGASVELVNSSNAVVATTTTAANGTYTFTAIPAGIYSVRVVADSVNSTRSGSNGTELGVITYRTDGTTPTTTVGTAIAQAVDLTLGDLSGVNFGFNFDTVSNTNDSGAGSLRQFILNANLLGGDSSLQQDGLPAGKENAVLMLSNTDPNYSNSVWKITLNSSLPNIDKPLILDGSKQAGFNSVTARPVIELNGNGGSGNGLTLISGSSGSQIRSLALTNFGGDGINVQGNSTNNSFLGNSIHSNGDLGIDLNNDGVTPNDVGDSDTGPNNLLNFPEAKVNSFGTNGTKVISYDFNLDLAAGNYRVEFFSNAAKDPSGHGEGQTYLGYKDITHLGNGSMNFKGTLNANQTVASGAFIATTLTRKTGANTFAETSEFSGVRDGITTQVCEDLASGTGGDMMVDEGATVIKLLEAKDKDGNPITYVISGSADKDMFVVTNPTAGATLDCTSIKFISSNVVITKSAPAEAQTRAVIPPGFPAPGNFEMPLDQDQDNVYELQITATYANGSKIVRDLKVGVIDLNEAPLITSPTSISFAEDSKADVLDIAAQDPDTGTTEAKGLTFRISGGADAAAFAIAPVGGVLRFINPPDYDAPQDANRDNVYEVEVTVSDTGGLSDTKLFKVTVTNNPADDGIAINVKALLQGAYDGKSGRMATQLNQLGLLPSKQPYSVAPFHYKGTETLSAAVQQASGNDAVVDWVLVELRSASNAVVASRALMLQSDGDVVDPQSGSNQLHFANVPAGNYTVSLRHRNHLAVVIASPISLSSTAQMIDFAAAATAVKGAGSRLLAGTRAMLWTGDINASHTLTANGPSNDVTTLLSSVLTHSDNAQGQTNYIVRGYLPTDVNLDGKTQFSGPGNDTSLLVGNILLHPLNTGFAANYIVRGGLAQ